MLLLFSLAVRNSLCDVKRRCCQESASSFSSTRFVRSACLNAQEQSMTCRKRSFWGAGIRLHSGQTRVGPSGSAGLWDLPSDLEPTRNENPLDSCWDRGRMLRVGNERIEEEERSCGTLSMGPRTCRPRVRCCSSVQDQGDIICHTQCLHHVLRRAHKPTMWACNGPCSASLASFPEAHSNRWRVSWHRSQCAWRVWAFDRQPGWQPWLSVPLGQMRCPWLRLPPRLFCTRPTHTLVWGNCKTHRTCGTIAGSLDVHYGRNCVYGQHQVPHEVEPGEWPHGWQYFTSSASEHHFRDRCAPSVVHR